MKDFKEFSKLLALESGKIIKRFFRTPFKVEDKKDDSPVTIADKKAEETMRNLIMKEFPDHGIIGEEFGNHNEKSEYQWVLDPIDGTASFICGAVNFGTLIGLLKNGEPILGIINQPILDEYLIGDNLSTELNEVKVVIRECSDLAKAFLLTTEHLNIGKYQNEINFNKLVQKVKLYRNLGDCYGYYLLATGFVDIMIDPIMHIWDIVPIIPIIKGAGGVVSDYQGKDPLRGTSLIATSKRIHEEVIAILNHT